jgi:adenine phosphoribosyltransferase
MSIEILKKSLMNAPVVKKLDYYYIIHPITDGVPEISPELLKEVTNEIESHLEKFGKIDKIVTMEAMGIPLASVLSIETNIPFTIIRKREYGLPDEISVEQLTGYSTSKLFINGLKKGDNIIIVDDVLSTGGTLKAVLSAMKQIDVNIKGVIIAVDKGRCAKKISDEFNVDIVTLINVDVDNEKVVIK